MNDDPFAVLGVDRAATPEQLRAARRRLALELHPDHGGDPVRMQLVNAAYDDALDTIERGDHSAPPAKPEPDPSTADTPQGAGSRVTPHGSARSDGRIRAMRTEWEPAAFVIELPVPDAYDALLVVTSWIGELASDEGPHAMDVLLAEPVPCWCRLELLPEGRSTSVGILVGAAESVERPTVNEVRDTWVAHLNQLARWEQAP